MSCCHQYEIDYCCKPHHHHSTKKCCAKALRAAEAAQATANAAQVSAGVAQATAVKALNTEVAQLKAKLPDAASLIDNVVALVPADYLSVPADPAEYATVLAKCDAVRAQFAVIYGPTARVLYMEPDGTVILDTSKGALNTFANYKAKIINENHNTRVSIISAQLFTSGVGAEIRFSSTIQAVQPACGKIQTGTQFNNQGTIRVSYTSA